MPPESLEPGTVALLAILFFVASMLYASVGHAGASAYLAAMILVGVPRELMKPTAFSLNILVASLVGTRFARAGHFRWHLFWPLAVGSVPATILGTTLPVAPTTFKVSLAVVLILGASRLGLMPDHAKPLVRLSFSTPLALAVGVVIGLISGMTGTGGGIFLSPLFLLCGWAEMQTVAAISALFILVNSAAGLAGSMASSHPPPWAITLWLPVVALGGWIGSSLGLGGLAPIMLRRLLAIVMLVACIKLLTG
jgi:uncharacterized membrane protein YfcA